MRAGPAGVGRIALAFLWLALFSLLYTAGEAFGLWPELPPGALLNLDLAVGAAGLAALCLWLLLRRPSA
jgi:hypothetical protein